MSPEDFFSRRSASTPPRPMARPSVPPRPMAPKPQPSPLQPKPVAPKPIVLQPQAVAKPQRPPAISSTQPQRPAQPQPNPTRPVRPVAPAVQSRPTTARPKAKKSGRKWAVLAIVLLLVLGGGAYGYWHFYMNKSSAAASIPADIQSQAGFKLMAPSKGIDPTTVKFNQAQKTLSYKIGTSVGGLTISQQPTPSTFTSIPGYADSVYKGFNQYATFDSPLGTVHLTRPGGASGANVAILDHSGTLLFASSSKELSQADWQKVFATLQQI